MKNYFAIVLLHLIASAFGARILAIFPIGGTSHYAPAEAVLKALAHRGHQVTSITSYPQKSPIPNMRDIDVSSVKGVSINSLSMNLVSTVLQRTDTNLNFIAKISRSYCEIAFSLPQVKDVLKESYDLVITEIFGADCSVGLAWKLQVPFISISSSKAAPWVYDRLGSPCNPSYMHSIHVDYPSLMSFYERLWNTMYYLYFTTVYNYYHNGIETDQLSRSYFGDEVPPVSEIVKNTSLVFVNSHFSLDASYPVVPNLVEIGGIHIKEPKPLPSTIQKFMDTSKHGVIYFTLGSLVRVSTLSNETIQAFKDAFKALPCKVLWKFELDQADVPSNVFISKWFPQADILRHPNLKLFITHGGQLGTIEAVYNAVPLVGIPLFFDQHRNIRNLVDKGVAVRLGLNELTKENILSAINTILNDKSYSSRMTVLSKKFKDRPLSPNETAVYWTEYVIRHKGAYHLRSKAATLPWYQYFLIDVILFIVILIFSLIFLIYYMLKTFLRLCLNYIPYLKTKSE